MACDPDIGLRSLHIITVLTNLARRQLTLCMYLYEGESAERYLCGSVGNKEGALHAPFPCSAPITWNICHINSIQQNPACIRGSNALCYARPNTHSSQHAAQGSGRYTSHHTANPGVKKRPCRSVHEQMKCKTKDSVGPREKVPIFINSTYFLKLISVTLRLSHCRTAVAQEHLLSSISCTYIFEKKKYAYQLVYYWLVGFFPPPV